MMGDTIRPPGMLDRAVAAALAQMDANTSRCDDIPCRYPPCRCVAEAIKAAIIALREPTDAMLGAVHFSPEAECHGADAEYAWQAMIDAALEEETANIPPGGELMSAEPPTVICDENHRPAPQDRCYCPSCRWKRERSIPEELLKFLSDRTSPNATRSLSMAPYLVRNGLMAYIGGQISLDEAWTRVIKQLVEQLDKETEFRIRSIELRMEPIFPKERV